MLEIENMEELFIEESDWSDSLLGYVEVKEEKKHLKAATTSTVANVPRRSAQGRRNAQWHGAASKQVSTVVLD